MGWIARRDLFDDRRAAGRALAEALRDKIGEDALLLALPRGGLPVAFEIACAFGAELDVLVVRKIGAPGHEELGLGAVVDGAPPRVVMNPRVMHVVRPSEEHVEAETARQIRELERRRRLYRGDRPLFRAEGRPVVVVDDGVATGGTARAALEAARAMEPSRLLLAAPVAARDTRDALAAHADEVVVLSAPEDFYAVGAHYRDFAQTEDEEVISLLAEAARLRGDA